MGAWLTCCHGKSKPKQDVYVYCIHKLGDELRDRFAATWAQIWLWQTAFNVVFVQLTRSLHQQLHVAAVVATAAACSCWRTQQVARYLSGANTPCTPPRALLVHVWPSCRSIDAKPCRSTLINNCFCLTSCVCRGWASCVPSLLPPSACVCSCKHANTPCALVICLACALLCFHIACAGAG
jgi:hypothetical protein